MHTLLIALVAFVVIAGFMWLEHNYGPQREWIGPMKTHHKTVHIKVLEEHINRGVRRNCDSCAITLAAVDALPRCTVIKTTNDTIHFENEDGYFCHGKLPDEAREFVDAFDNGHLTELRPFEFDVTVKYFAPDTAT